MSPIQTPYLNSRMCGWLSTNALAFGLALGSSNPGKNSDAFGANSAENGDTCRAVIPTSPAKYGLAGESTLLICSRLARI